MVTPRFSNSIMVSPLNNNMRFSNATVTVNTEYFELINKEIVTNNKTYSLYLFATIKKIPTVPISILSGLQTNNSVVFGAITDGFGVPLKLISAALNNKRLELNPGQISQFTGHVGHYIIFNFSYSV